MEIVISSKVSKSGNLFFLPEMAIYCSNKLTTLEILGIKQFAVFGKLNPTID